MRDRVFVDTNLWVYLYSDKPEGKVIEKLLGKYFATITVSTQVLGELFNVLTKKNFKTKEETRDIILDLAMSFRVVEIDELSVVKAIKVSIEYKFSYWDGLIIASALENNCSTLYSEDMQHEQVIEEKLRIINPFGVRKISNEKNVSKGSNLEH